MNAFGDPATGREGAGHDESLAARAAHFLRENFREAIAVEDLADHLCYSGSHLTRAFTRAVGVSPIRYLAALRFHEAKRLLAFERLGVTEACHEVGYSSPGTFTRRFVEDVGLPPGGFRRAADRFAETTLGPVSLRAPGRCGRVRVRLDVRPELVAGLGEEPYQWIGTFPTPVPRGAPYTGTLRRGIFEVELPVHPAAPWMLVTLTPGSGGVGDHLWPTAPLVARHPRPLSPGDGTVTLSPSPARPWDFPVVVALAALHPRI